MEGETTLHICSVASANRLHQSDPADAFSCGSTELGDVQVYTGKRLKCWK